MTALPALALAMAASTGAAQAQVAGGTPGAVEDYRLPPAAPAPSAAGPVDSDHPTAQPTRAAPASAPTPASEPAPPLIPPLIALPPPPVTTPAAEPGPQPAPRAERPAPLPAQPLPAPAPATLPSAILPAPAPSAAPPASEIIPAPAIAPHVERTLEESAPWPWIAGGAALVLLLGGYLVWRRRGEADEVFEDEPAAPAEAAPQPSPPATLTPPSRPQRDAPAPTSPPPPTPLPRPTFGPQPIEMQLEARHLSRALVNATLAYRLTLTNRTDSAIGPLRIGGDIVSAHASLSAQEQLDPGDALATIHEVPSLAPGETVLLSGELRLPIASILPIHSGGARVFVPLARFRAETQMGSAATRVFVIGQAGNAPNGALRPFLLDRGPGVDRAIGQRELNPRELGVAA